MVAVPLIGQTRPVGVLCAYYRDVCLFDQGTLDRLMTIGRMVGTAIENSAAPSGAVTPASTGPADSALDAFLALLTTQALTQIHVFEALVKVAAKSLSPAGLICGPLRMSATDLTITVAEGAGIPPSTISHRFVVPPVLSQQLLLGRGNFRQSPVSWEMLGPFQPLVTGRAFSTICHPIVWRKQPQAAVVAWRSEKKPFTGEDELLLTRLSAISSLALRAL